MRDRTVWVSVLAALALGAVVVLSQSRPASANADDGWTLPNTKAVTLAVNGMH